MKGTSLLQRTLEKRFEEKFKNVVQNFKNDIKSYKKMISLKYFPKKHLLNTGPNIFAFFLVLFLLAIVTLRSRCPSPLRPELRALAQRLSSESKSFSASSDSVMIVTSAYSSAWSNTEERDKEYVLGLSYVFSHFPRVVGLVSSHEAWPLADLYTWDQLYYFEMSPRWTTKSAQESEGLRWLVSMLESNMSISDDAVIYKVSGRYQIVRNDFIEAVSMHPNFDVWAKPFGSWEDNGGVHKINPGRNKIFTFFFAMRWKYVRDLYKTVDLYKLSNFDTVPSRGWRGYDIESYIMDYVNEKGLRLWEAPYLHVVGNIGNKGFLTYF